MLDKEFGILEEHLKRSTCLKQAVVAGTYIKGQSEGFAIAANHCYHTCKYCPREANGCPSGEGYDLCRSFHAEANLANLLSGQGLESEGIVWLLGHSYACEDCKNKLRLIGVDEIRILKMEPTFI